MADILPTLQQFPPAGSNTKKKLSPKDYDTSVTSYLKEISKIKEASFTKSCEGKNLLDWLDPAVNSLAVMITFNKQYAIAAVNKDTKRIEALLPFGVNFLLNFDPIQVRYAGEEWRVIWESVCLTLSNSHSTDLSPLVTGLLRLYPTAATFTSHHLRAVRLALSSNVPSQVLPLLDRNITAYPQKHTKNLPSEYPSEDHDFSNAFITQKSGFSIELKSEYVLEYYLLGASIYLALNNPVRARLFLEHVLLSPSLAKSGSFSALQVEAYAKWLMLGLLVEGKQFPYPKTMDPTVMKNIRNVSTPYETLVADFERRDLKKFEADMDVAGTIWADDGNLRLVKEVALQLQRFRIIDLQKTYAALPVERVAELLELPGPDTTNLLKNMIETGSLLASLSGNGEAFSANGEVLSFHSSEAKLPELRAGADDLEVRTGRIEELVRSVREADRRLQLSREFVEWSRRAKKAGGSAGEGDLADVMDLEYDNPVGVGPMLGEPVGGEDEDLMQ